MESVFAVVEQWLSSGGLVLASLGAFVGGRKPLGAGGTRGDVAEEADIGAAIQYECAADGDGDGDGLGGGSIVRGGGRG